jgi:protein SCO1
LAFLFLTACTNPASKLPNYGKVPQFAMTDASGKPFDRRMMDGSVWVIDFIYTNCPAACPLMTSKMHRLTEQFQGTDNVSFLSISVDPDRDTPPALTQFAHRYGGPTPKWHFLTGTPATVHLLAYTTFHVGDIINKMEHGTYFIVVDKRGNIRGFYSSLDQDSLKSLVKDVRALKDAQA